MQPLEATLLLTTSLESAGNLQALRFEETPHPLEEALNSSPLMGESHYCMLKLPCTQFTCHLDFLRMGEPGSLGKAGPGCPH